MSARFTRHNTAKQRKGVAQQRDRAQHFRPCRVITAHPQLFMVLPLGEGQLQRAGKRLLNGRFRRGLQKGGRAKFARRVALREMIPARGFAQAALTQAGERRQLRASLRISAASPLSSSSSSSQIGSANSPAFTSPKSRPISMRLSPTLTSHFSR